MLAGGADFPPWHLSHGNVMRNYAVRRLRHAARRHGATRLPPLLQDLTLRVRGLALCRQHRPAPAGHTSHLFTEVARLVRPGAWTHDGPPSGGLRWSTPITSTLTGDHTANPNVGALSRERHVASRGEVTRNSLASVGLRHRCSSHLSRAV